MRFLRWSLLSLVLTVAVLSPARAAFDKIIVFGDSLSDLGASPSAVLSAFKLLLGNCATQFPCPPYSDGRISNGPVAIETFASLAGLNSPAGLQGFAIGGAMTNNDNFAVPGGPGMRFQLNTYFALTGGPADPNALYVVWGGANDFFRAIENATLGPATALGAVSNLSGYVTELAIAGARQFLVPNIPDLSVTPAARAIDDLLGDPAGDMFLANLSLLSDAFNTGLETAMADIRTAIPGLALDLFPVDEVVDAVIANPGAFGFSNVTESCLSLAGVCTDPSSYLFWDAAHPTASAHRMLGQQMFLAVVPVAPTLALMLLGLPILVMAVRRRS